MKKNRKALFLAAFVLCAIIFSFVYTLVEGDRYTILTNIYMPELDTEFVHAEYSNDGIVELTDARLGEHIFDNTREMELDFQAVAEGKTNVKVYYRMLSDNSDNLVFTRDYELRVTGLGTVIDITGYYINFQTYPVLLGVLMVFLVVTLIMLIVSFFEYRRNGDFNYRMIACGGLSIFISVLLLMMIYDLVNNFLRTFFEFMKAFLDVGLELFLLISPFMVILSVLLTISNIRLMRHEGYRPLNALGIIFGLLCTISIALILFIDFFPAFRDIYLRNLLQRTITYLFCYFGAMFLSTVICAFLSTRYRPAYDRDYIIILGCGIRRDGSLTPLLKGRVDAALAFEKEQYEKTGKHAVFVPSGGQGSDEVISESQAMTDYLTAQGIAPEYILMEDKSVNTLQNMQFSKQVIEKHTKDFKNCKIAFATTNYHIFRGYILAKKNGFIAKGISAKTKNYFFPNAFVREFIGLIYDCKYNHIVFVLLTLGIFVFLDYVYKLL